MKTNRNTFLVNAEWYDSLKVLPPEAVASIFLAMFEFHEGNETPNVAESAVPVWLMMRPFCREMKSRYDDICKKRSEAGKQGGAPKGNQNATKNKQNNQKQAKQPESESESDSESDSESESDSDKHNKCVCGIGATPLKRAHARRTQPPTPEEVRTYCEERGNKVDPERFFDYYTANGWRVGKSPMKNWKAAFRNWERREKQEREGKGDYTFDEYLDRVIAEEEAKERGGMFE